MKPTSNLTVVVSVIVMPFNVPEMKRLVILYMVPVPLLCVASMSICTKPPYLCQHNLCFFITLLFQGFRPTSARTVCTVQLPEPQFVNEPTQLRRPYSQVVGCLAMTPATMDQSVEHYSPFLFGVLCV